MVLSLQELRLLTGITCLLFFGCAGGQDGAARGGREPDFVGFITAIEPAGGDEVLATLVVESHANKLVRRRLVRVTKASNLVEQRSGSRRPIQMRSIRVKDWVRIWFDRPFDEPPPAAADAAQVIVMRDNE